MNTTNPGLILHISESDNKTMFMTESGEVEG